LARLEGIIPALESVHAIAEVMKVAPATKGDQIVLVNRSGRGDKDVDAVAEECSGGVTLSSTSYDEIRQEVLE